MPLTEFQREWMKRSGSSPRDIEIFEHSPYAQETIPKTTLAAGILEEQTSITSLLPIFKDFASEPHQALEAIANLRSSLRRSQRGPIKSALTMLQGFNIIDDLLEGPIRIPPRPKVRRFERMLSTRLRNVLHDFENEQKRG